MSKQARPLPALVLLLGVLACLMIFKPGGTTPRHRGGPGFRTAEEARRYAAARILAAERPPSGGNPYADSFHRTYTTLAGRTSHHFLVDEPERELELARDFLRHGFSREALTHYENLISYFPDTPQGRTARERIDDCRRRTVLGLVAPLSILVRDGTGDLCAPVAAPCPRPPALDRIQDPFLEPAPNPGFTIAGFVDDAGNIVLGDPDPSHPNDPRRQGAVATDRGFYRIPRDARSLFEAERLAKARLFDGVAGAHVHADDPQGRLAAEAMIYLGMKEQGLALLDDLGDRPSNPLEGSLPEIANDPAHPLALDAVWLIKLHDNPRFTLSTKSSATAGEELPVEIDAQAVREMTFTFAKLDGPIPSEEPLAKEWLKKATATPAHRRTHRIRDGKSTILLQMPQPGTYRVTAEVRDRSCTFLAIRAETGIEIFALPGETKLRAPRGGFTLASGQKVLGTSDDEGWIVPAGTLSQPRPPICAEHRECCAGCVSCGHHHGETEVSPVDPRIFVTGRGQLFRAQAKLDTAEVAKVKAPAAAPLLLVYTDRPAYKAGDTMRFRAILRLPKTPLDRKDETRLLPGAEQEVAVAIRCGETSLFQRAYVTGEYGTFAGEFTIPLSAARSEYAISVAAGGSSVAQPFEVLDYRKSDYALTLTPGAGGVRVGAGYVWGAPVPGATLRCTVNGNDVEAKDGFVPLKEGQRLRVFLMRDGEELARKSLLFRAPVTDLPVEERKAEGPAPTVAAPPTTAAAKKIEKPALRVRPSKSVYGRGEEIEVAVEAPFDETEATVVLADVQLYDVARVELIDGRGTARFPVRAILDPGVAVFALCGGRQARADIQVRAEAMRVKIAAPAKGRPGENVEVLLKADPRAALSLAAVDEAIYMIREDDTPEIYSHFHPARPAALAYARFDRIEFDGETHKVDGPPEHSCIREGELVSGRPFRGKGAYAAISGGGFRYGGRLGGKRNMVARGGGGGMTEDAVLSSFKGLAPLQKADGSWSTAFASEAGTIDDLGATALVLLSKLGAGYSHLSKDTYNGFCFGDMIRKALEWIMARQDAEGALGPRQGDFLLNHALAALALSEAYGLTGSNLFKASAQKAVDFLASQQSGSGGWHRADRSKSGEILPTVFGVMLLKSAQISGLTFPTTCAVNAARFFDQEIDEDGICGDVPTRAKVAGGMLALLWLRKDKNDARVRGALAWLLANKPQWEQQDFLGWHLGGLAVYCYDGPNGRCWRQWDQPHKDTLVKNQGKDGLWIVRGESIFHSAIGTMALEVYYRYANVFGTRDTGEGGAGDLPPLAPRPRVRLYFPDTAFWAPEIVTDERGEARASFTLPDQITTTRLTARGITKGAAAGQAIARIEAQQPFFVKIRCPEFAVLDDEIEIRAEVFNYTGKELRAAVGLEGFETRQVAVPVDRPGAASWRVRAKDAGGLRLVATARAGDHADAMERLLPVRRLGSETMATARGKAKTGESFRFDAAPDAEDFVVKVQPRQGTLPQLLDALRYLNSYPYG